MTTVTKVQTLADKATDIDFETRLAMASAGMDALLSHKHGDAVSEANKAAEAAKLMAGTITVAPARFQSNDILARAREIIETRGWAQNALQLPNGAVCAIGAIRIACYGSAKEVPDRIGDDEIAAHDELLNRITARTGRTGYTVPLWNDSRTTVDEVIELLY